MIPSSLSEWLTSKKQVIAYANRDKQQGEHFSIVGGSTKMNNNFGSQHIGLLEKKYILDVHMLNYCHTISIVNG